MPGAPFDPTTFSEREGVAKTCSESLKLSMPFLIDDMNDSANRAYGAWPDRLYVIGVDGKVAYKGGPGPWGFRPAEAREALVKTLKASK